MGFPEKTLNSRLTECLLLYIEVNKMSTNLDVTETRTAQKGVLILSHSRARGFRPEKFGVTTCSMIRVEDPNTAFKELIFKNQFKAISYFNFDDAVTEYNPAYGFMKLMTEQQAEEIVNFFEHIRDHQLVVVHCYAGVCRSSAIAAAFCKFIGDKETHELIWNCGKYVPNTHVYFTLLDTLQKRGYDVEYRRFTEVEEQQSAEEWVKSNGWSQDDE
jgi:predicted protein tyrosine phosphatase